MSKIGYVRVSTAEQHLDRQLALMNEIGIERIFQDKASGKNLKRCGFEEMMKFLRPGDELHVESFSRLSRSTQELLETVETLKNTGVTLVSHKENIDTATPSGKLMLTMFAALSEFEREVTLERQREGIEAAKKRGVYKGRKRIEDTKELQLALWGWSTGELTVEKAAKIAGMSRTSFYNRIKEKGCVKIAESDKE